METEFDRKVLCACRRLHVFKAPPGVHAKTCVCGRKVAILIKPPSRFSLLEVD